MRTQILDRKRYDQRPEGMICKGCGGPVKELARHDSSKLRRGFAEEHPALLRSFQCDRCEVILFSDEFTLGRFVPPQFRLETSAGGKDPCRPTSGNEALVALQASGAFRSKQA